MEEGSVNPLVRVRPKKIVTPPVLPIVKEVNPLLDISIVRVLSFRLIRPLMAVDVLVNAIVPS
jgi:hypothetical protein